MKKAHPSHNRFCRHRLSDSQEKCSSRFLLQEGVFDEAVGRSRLLLSYLVFFFCLGGIIGPQYSLAMNCSETVTNVHKLPPQVVKQGFTFANIKVPLGKKEVSSRIADQLSYLLMDRRSLLFDLFDRMQFFGPAMREIIAEEKLPVDLYYVSVLLSDLVPNASKRGDAVGWWSLGQERDRRELQGISWFYNSDWDDRRDPALSTRIACNLFKGISSRFPEENWFLTIAGYVDGAEKIEAIIKKSPGFSYWDLVMPPFSDTFVPRVVALKLIDTYRSFYGVNVVPAPVFEYDFLERLKLTKDLPLHVVAKWCSVSPRLIWELNPGVNPSTGILPVVDKKNQSGLPLRVPKGLGNRIRGLLIKEGYISG
jgi:hypothetical protein